MSRYYKVVDENEELIQIGIDDNTGTEITETEYNELYKHIQENAVHTVEDIDERGVIGG